MDTTPSVLRGKVALFPLTVTDPDCRAMVIGRFDGPTHPLTKRLGHKLCSAGQNGSSDGRNGTAMDNESSLDHLHVARGQHTGLVVSKKICLRDEDLTHDPDITLQFKVFLASHPMSGPNQLPPRAYTQERRVIKFWFKSVFRDEDSMWKEANAFFTQLLSPKDFPRDYVGFIKKVMKMLQRNTSIEVIELRLSLLPPDPIGQAAQSPLPKSAKEFEDEIVLQITDLIIEWIESAYPNSVSTTYLTKSVINTIQTHEMWETFRETIVLEEKVTYVLAKLRDGGKVVRLRDDTWIRVSPDGTDPAKNVPKVSNSRGRMRGPHDRNSNSSTTSSQYDNNLSPTPSLNSLNRLSLRPNSASYDSSGSGQYSSYNVAADKRWPQPTVAIVTSKFCEKLAVDAMIADPWTFIKYKSQGDNHVYTLGNIGPHRVVSTKLPTLGNSRQAMTAAGNGVTRMLGTFQEIKYVFLVGVGTGVDHFVEYTKQFRLGDVVVSSCNPSCDYIYIRCDEKVPEISTSDGVQIESDSWLANGLIGSDPIDDPEQLINSKFTFRTWRPKSLELENIIHNIICEYIKNPKECSWNNWLQEGSDRLKGLDTNFSKPAVSPNEDKLAICVGNGDVVQIDNSPPKPRNLDRKPAGAEIIEKGVGNDAPTVTPNGPNVHLGAVGSLNFATEPARRVPQNGVAQGSGRSRMFPDMYRPLLSQKFGILAFDTDLHPVIESVEGNCVTDYVIIRGIAEHCHNSIVSGGSSSGNYGRYRRDDKGRAKAWAPYASLTAAAVMKSMIMGIKPNDNLNN